MAANAQSHRSDPRILGRRTLERNHRHLAPLLRPGMSVLDVGCGTGAITLGIAAAVGVEGRVVGVDRDARLLEIARRENAALEFVKADATALPFEAQFDIVTAARTLQWISDPGLAIRGMKAALKPRGLLAVLDYNHARNAWEPDPPAEFRAFYEAFLKWRAAHEWNNLMGDRLPGLLDDAGLVDIVSVNADEVTRRGDADFVAQADLWPHVMGTLGEPVVAEGFLAADLLRNAQQSVETWWKTELVTQTLSMRTVIGRRPVAG